MFLVSYRASHIRLTFLPPVFQAIVMEDVRPVLQYTESSPLRFIQAYRARRHRRICVFVVACMRNRKRRLQSGRQRKVVREAAGRAIPAASLGEE